MSFDITSLTTARKLVFAQLVSATRSVDGRDAFCGYLPPVADRWALFISDGPDVAPFRGVPASPEMWMTARLDGQFKSLEGAEAFALSCMSVMPMRSLGDPVRVQWFRPVRMPTIEPEYMQLAGMDDLSLVWVVRIPCEIVLNTSEA